MSKFIVEREKHCIRVTDGPSTFTAEDGGYINVYARKMILAHSIRN
jgi:hypothetical protein